MYVPLFINACSLELSVCTYVCLRTYRVIIDAYDVHTDLNARQHLMRQVYMICVLYVLLYNDTSPVK